jgi:AhpD family alkylhydroperoxidase
MLKKDLEYYSKIIDVIAAYGSRIPDEEKSFSTTKQMEDGTLTKQVKQLIALAISINAHNPDCTNIHVKNALRAGCDEHNILEAIGVAVLLGGNKTIVNGKEALEALARLTGNHRLF